MNKYRVRSMLKYSVLVLGLVFSGSAFSTLLQIDWVEDASFETGHVNDDESLNVSVTGGVIASESYSVDFSYISTGGTEVLTFLYGIWTDADDSPNGVGIEIYLNDNLVNTITAIKGYNFVGYELASIEVDSAFFAASGMQTLTFTNTAVEAFDASGKPINQISIGRIEMDYTPGNPQSKVPSGSVPEPETLLLIMFGLAGLFYMKKSRT